MLEAAEAKELIDEAIERVEGDESAERAIEKRFRDRVSVLIGILAVTLAIIHMAAAGAQRESVLKAVEASDTFAYMQAKIVRETIYLTAGGDPAARADYAREAARLRAPAKSGHGIGQLEARGNALQAERAQAVAAGEGYELGETALQMAIVLLSIALVARSRPIVWGAVGLALAGGLVALATAAGVALPWS